MTNYKLTIAYDGTNFEGFQTQTRLNSRTVQDSLNLAINQMFKNPIPPLKIIGASRTDAGVHALGQVANIDIEQKIDQQGLLMGINSLLPKDVVIQNVQIVDDDFNARFSAVGKHYYYLVNLDKFANPLTRNYTGNYPWPVDLDLIQTAAKDLIGEHDFSSFAAAGNQTKSTIRKIEKIEVSKIDSQNNFRIDFYGDSFLYKQIRIMVAVLLEIGSQRRPVDQIPAIISAKNRDLARWTAPASGLYLNQIFYK